jgi:molybdopterin-guanine dinucleotide biosynthesis protein A
VVEVGPGVTAAPSVWEDIPGSGPLAAVNAGARYLRGIGHDGPVLVVACDLPLVNETAFRTLADWPGSSSVVPVVQGSPNPLCARWSAADLVTAEGLVQAGARSMHALMARSDIVLAGEETWPSGLGDANFADVDTADELDRLGLSWHPA